jgi:hypothetical protein
LPTIGYLVERPHLKIEWIRCKEALASSGRSTPWVPRLCLADGSLRADDQAVFADRHSSSRCAEEHDDIADAVRLFDHRAASTNALTSDAFQNVHLPILTGCGALLLATHAHQVLRLT